MQIAYTIPSTESGTWQVPPSLENTYTQEGFVEDGFPGAAEPSPPTFPRLEGARPAVFFMFPEEQVQV